MYARPDHQAPDQTVDTYILPYPSNALQPHLDSTDVSAHLARIQALEQALASALAGSDLAQMDLDVVLASSQGQRFAMVADYLGRRLFLDGLCARGGGEPGGRIGERIKADFGSLPGLQEAFSQLATQLPADGWIWLVEQADGRLAATAHAGTGNPATGTSRPLLACPLEQHDDTDEQTAASLTWLSRFWKLVNWDNVERQLR